MFAVRDGTVKGRQLGDAIMMLARRVSEGFFDRIHRIDRMVV